MTGAPAILLDRDGTIIVEQGYLSDPALVTLEANAAAGLRRLADAGFALVVVSNQSGIARGYFDRATVDAVHARLDTLLRAEGIRIAGWYVCPHAPDAGCACRKPGDRLARQAAADLGLDLAGSWVVGDKPSDIGLGDAIGAQAILVRTGHGAEAVAWATRHDVPVCADLDAAADLILAVRQ